MHRECCAASRGLGGTCRASRKRGRIKPHDRTVDEHQRNRKRIRLRSEKPEKYWRKRPTLPSREISGDACRGGSPLRCRERSSGFPQDRGSSGCRRATTSRRMNLPPCHEAKERHAPPAQGAHLQRMHAIGDRISHGRAISEYRSKVEQRTIRLGGNQMLSAARHEASDTGLSKRRHPPDPSARHG